MSSLSGADPTRLADHGVGADARRKPPRALPPGADAAGSPTLEAPVRGARLLRNRFRKPARTPAEPHHPPHHRNPQALWAARAEALRNHPHADFLRKTTDDALDRLLVPSLEREIRRELTHRSEGHAVEVFARNLRGKLLAPPLRGRRVLAVDPGFRTGCKLAVLDETGNLLEDGVVLPASRRRQQAGRRQGFRLEEMVRKHQVQVIAIGNGTACRETEEVVSELIADLDARRHGRAPERRPPNPLPRPPRSRKSPRRPHRPSLLRRPRWKSPRPRLRKPRRKQRPLRRRK